MRLAVRPYTRLGVTTQYDEGRVQLSHTAGSELIFDGSRRSLLQFSNSDDAAQFANEYSGRTISYDKINRMVISEM